MRERYMCVGGESGSFCYSPGWEREYVLNLFVLLNHSRKKISERATHRPAIKCMQGSVVCSISHRGVFFGSKRETGSILR
jgi:hypothetical protein